ncbi:primosomal protein N' [Vitreoscilla filiformis]|uniref:Replication restart protein PriA n=1 Tax=Vitreoscilla filiformis TaxID=63 RepID=A0A221KCZ1_VITFI|nr:primosomal protein N' [Vitreoscilla filiformis]ASM76892.1 primosomal protein N' [Vitreoscilla filiformis]
MSAERPARWRIAVDAPQHVGLGDWLDYVTDLALQPGQLVRVPLGQREVLGVVWAPVPSDAPVPPGVTLRAVTQVLAHLSPLPERWRQLVAFTARYYQRSLGEVALAVLPPELRKLDDGALQKKQARWCKKPPISANAGVDDALGPALTPEQHAAGVALEAALHAPEPGCYVLHGVTGSGKTEVYLRAAQQALALGRQVLVLVPEINLTPQLEARFMARFPGRCVVALHSGLTPAQRLKHWCLAHQGAADLVLGTRLALFGSLPRLGLIVVDEEHDPSYKQQDGARYSARDLAVYRGRLDKVPVVLGSATPSLESWHHAQTGRYRLLTMAERIGQARLPRVRILDMTLAPPRAPNQPPPVLAKPLLDAIRERMARGEQSLLFLNRRGFAPVLQCQCGWRSGCPHCSAFRVFHKLDRTLRCHHCGFTERVPAACPDCGNLDIQPIGRGTERLEEQVAELLPEARVARIDADTTRLKGTLEQQLAAVHAGEVDILVGTQMITKGHDFRRVTLVAAVNPDSALYAADFRAPERLFASLMQAAGRAGRDAAVASEAEMWIQTWTPAHALFAALKRHDFAAFAAHQLAEREMAGLPPFAHLALLRCEAREPEAAEGFLQAARDVAQAMLDAHPDAAAELMLYAPVPPAIAKVAGFERRQMLVEASARPWLQQLLAQWLPQLHALRAQFKVVRWAVDVDPLSI